MVENLLKSACRCVLCIVIFLVCTVNMSAADRDDVSHVARKLLTYCETSGGLIVHLGGGDGSLTAALGADNNYLVHRLAGDAATVDAARRHLQSLGIYGRVSVDQFHGEQLPYADNLVNLFVVEDPGPVDESEVMRVVAPLGTACFLQDGEWTVQKKRWPDDIGQWSHPLHGPDGNAVVNDRVVGPPRHVQWVCEPRWQRHHELTPSLNAMVSCKGRLFAIINEAPAGIDGLPDQWALVARDAFNGTLLWKRPISEWGWKQWGDHSYGHGRWNHPTHITSRLVATGDRVYTTLGFNAPLTALDAATGETVMTFEGTEFTDEILYDDGRLILSVNTAPQGPGKIDEKPPVEKAVMALDADSGEVIWKTEGFTGIASKADAIERVTHLNMILGDSKVFLVEEDAVAALDLKTGKRMWRKERPSRPRPVTYGSYYFTNLCSMVYHDGIVFFMEPDGTLERQPWNAPAQSELLAISAATGEVLWKRKSGMWGHYNPGDIFVIDGLVWVHDDQEFSMMGLDPRSGEVKQRLSTKEALDQGHHHRCYRNKATPHYIVTGRRGVEFIDITSQENLRHHWVRGTCRYGVLPCNGLLYAPPHPCICYITSKLNGFWALAPDSRGPRGSSEASGHTRLEKGEAFGTPLAAKESSPHDWPTYRHDPSRSGAGRTEVSGELRKKWTVQLGARPTSPVIAGGRVFVATPDTHTLWALDAAQGTVLWKYTAGGRIDTPPTVYRGLALFGAADGWVYCLRAADGTVVWRRRAAPGTWRIVSHGRLESPWPVHGNVLVQNGVAYLAAGRSSFLDGGIHIYAVDPANGEVLQHKSINSIDPKTGDMAECTLRYDMPPEATGALPDILVGDGTHVYMRHLQFNPETLEYRKASDALQRKTKRSMYPYLGPHLMAVAGLLDDSWFSQTYWTVDAQSHCKLLVFDEETAYGVKPFSGRARHSRAIFRPGREGYTLFANRRPRHKARWSKKVPLRATALVLAGDRLFAAGTPDEVDPSDPWAALEGRRGGRLQVIETDDGSMVNEIRLNSPPIFDGMAAADGTLYVSQQKGQVACFSAFSTSRPPLSHEDNNREHHR